MRATTPMRDNTATGSDSDSKTLKIVTDNDENWIALEINALPADVDENAKEMKDMMLALGLKPVPVAWHLTLFYMDKKSMEGHEYQDALKIVQSASLTHDDVTFDPVALTCKVREREGKSVVIIYAALTPCKAAITKQQIQTQCMPKDSRAIPSHVTVFRLEA